jgi:hypothetical protein
MSTALSTQTSNSGVSQTNQSVITRPGFSSADSYKLCHQLSEVFAASHLVPTLYRANRANCMIAISMASRMQMDPLTVMQNLYIIQGKPSFSSQFLIASWNACGRFSPIRYKWSDKRDACRAISKDLQTGEELAGTLVTMAMAKAEGWIDKTGSKWKTMPEQMLMYRAAAFLVRAYGAEIALGMSTTEEAEDVSGIRASEPTSGDMVKLAIAPIEADVVTIADVEVIESSLEKAEVIEVAQVQPKAPSPPAEKVDPTAAVVAEHTQETSIVGTNMEGEAPVSKETLSHLGELVKQINPPKDKWVATLQKKYGVSSAKELNENQAQAVVKWARAQVEKKQLDEWAQGAGQKREASQEAAPFQTT